MDALLQTIKAVDAFTWVCFAGMAGFGAWLLVNQTGSWLISLIYFPGLLVGEFAFRLLLQRYNFMFVPDKTVDVMIVTCLGAMLSLLVLIVVSRLVLGLVAALTPAPQRDVGDLASLARRRV